MKAALIIMERYPDTGITFVPDNVNALADTRIDPGSDYLATRGTSHRRRNVVFGQYQP